jgi:hypothetical protein
VNYDRLPIISCEGFFNSDENKDYLQSFSPKKESICNRSILNVNGKEIIFDDLIPSIFVAKKVTAPYEDIIFRNDTLSLTFSHSEFGQNEFYKEKFIFVFDEPKNYFYLAYFEKGTCLLPDCDQIATLKLSFEDLKNPKSPFFYSNWGIDQSHVLITEKNRQKFRMYAIELKNMGIPFNDEWLNL